MTRSSEDAVAEVVAWLQADLERAPSLGELAARAGLSPYHFHRTFKRVVGMTPKRYVDSLRMRALKQGLREGRGVADGVYAGGFGSSSRVYERADAEIGMTPAQYRKGGEGVTVTHALVETPAGRLMLGATDRGLCFLQFGTSRARLLDALRAEYPRATLEAMKEPVHPHFARWAAEIRRYLAGKEPSPAIPLDLQATAFQALVWNYLRTIPYGEVRTYSDVAAAIGRPSARRAVAGACAANRVALLVPCHRVIRNDGGLGGYRWGVARKRALVAMERSAKGA
jgi:AraC family transcriptional regulator of adaptative response/methylated-DNA-[protein]-cysteine methyltransferase